MASTLAAALIALSKDLSDYWASTTTGAGSSTTIVDTSLLTKANDWITDETYVFLTEEPAGSAAIYDERKASSLDNSTGTVTTLAFAAAPGSGIDYEIHRLFSPSDKRIALVQAAKDIYPHLYAHIVNEELVSGNWLEDGSFERWDDSTTPTKWTATTLTATQTTTAGYFIHGSTSVALSTTAGTLSQGWAAGSADNDDLKYLRGRSVTFTLQVWCDTADAVRISANDGTTQTYSSYHDGGSAWTERDPRNDTLYVNQYIDVNATQVTFTVHYEDNSATCYVDDARVLSPYRNKLYVGHLGFADNKPHKVWIEPRYGSQSEPWIQVRDYRVDNSGYLYIPATYPDDRRLRLEGIGYLDFLASGSASTAWTATIALNEPELQVLSAQAALWLYKNMSLPNDESGTREEYQKTVGFWIDEVSKRKSKYGMKAPGATIHWGIRK